MHPEEFKLLDEIEDDHWWFVGKRLLLTSLLRRHARDGALLDLGCGTGGVLREVEGERIVLGVDGSIDGLRVCRRKGLASLVCADLSRMPFASGDFEVVLALDVIEHLDDDVGFLRDAATLCVRGGTMIVAVPAFQLLWSQHDETFQHRLRYSARQLRSVLGAAGLAVDRITYTNSLLFPLAAVWRILSYRVGLGRFAPRHDFWPVPRWVNRLFVSLYVLEAWLLRRVDLPVGLSVVAVVRIPATP